MDEIGHYMGHYSQPTEQALSSRWSNIVGGWWVLHISTFITSRVGSFMNSAAADNLENLLVFDRLLIFGHVLSFGSAIITIVLLRMIAPFEQRLSMAQQTIS